MREVTVTANSAGWMRILRQIRKFAEEAHEDLLGNMSNDPMTYMRLQLRWQQREAMVRGIEAYIKDCEDQKAMILDSLHRSVPPDAEQDREIA